jgi:hypothetical protein
MNMKISFRFLFLQHSLSFGPLTPQDFSPLCTSKQFSETFELPISVFLITYFARDFPILLHRVLLFPSVKFQGIAYSPTFSLS